MNFHTSFLVSCFAERNAFTLCAVECFVQYAVWFSMQECFVFVVCVWCQYMLSSRNKTTKQSVCFCVCAYRTYELSTVHKNDEHISILNCSKASPCSTCAHVFAMHIIIRFLFPSQIWGKFEYDLARISNKQKTYEAANCSFYAQVEV